MPPSGGGLADGAPEAFDSGIWATTIGTTRPKFAASGLVDPSASHCAAAASQVGGDGHPETCQVALGCALADCVICASAPCGIYNSTPLTLPTVSLRPFGAE